MKKTLLAFVSASMLALMMPLGAAASCSDDFSVYNGGSHTITEIYAAPVAGFTYISWGSNLLNAKLLPRKHLAPLASHYGPHARLLAVDRYIAIVYSDGTVKIKGPLDICKKNVKVTY